MSYVCIVCINKYSIHISSVVPRGDHISFSLKILLLADVYKMYTTIKSMNVDDALKLI